VAGGQEWDVGQRAAGFGDGLTHGGEDEAQPVGVVELVDHPLPVIQAGVVGDRFAGVVAAVGGREGAQSAAPQVFWPLYRNAVHVQA
jgi:hypothetical protein